MTGQRFPPSIEERLFKQSAHEDRIHRFAAFAVVLRLLLHLISDTPFMLADIFGTLAVYYWLVYFYVTHRLRKIRRGDY